MVFTWSDSDVYRAAPADTAVVLPRQQNHRIYVDCICQHLLKCLGLGWRMLKKKVHVNRRHTSLPKGQWLGICINHLLRKAAFIYLRNRVDKWNNTLQPHHMFIHWLVFVLALWVKWFFLSFLLLLLFHILARKYVNIYFICRTYSVGLLFFHLFLTHKVTTSCIHNALTFYGNCGDPYRCKLVVLIT